MDVKSFPRHFAYLILILSLLLPHVVYAQAGTCPDYTNELVPIPPGTYPGPTALCVNPNEGGDIYQQYNSNWPCGAGIAINPNYQAILNGEHPILTVVPPANQSFPSGLIRIRFLLSGHDFFGGNFDGAVTVRMITFDPSGNQLDIDDLVSTDFSFTVGEYGIRFYEIETVMVFQSGGYYTQQITSPLPLLINDVEVFNLGHVDGGTGFPLFYYCDIPGAPTPTPTVAPTATPTQEPTNTPTGTLPPTFTPGPTNTPGPTLTPSLTPQIFPTAPGGTITPLPSSTPIGFSTLPPPNTPTPWPGVTLPPITTPDIDVPFPNVAQATAPSFSVALTPNATAAARQTEVAGMLVGAGAVATEWAGISDQGLSLVSITNTVGISSPVEIAQDMIANVLVPLSVIRLLQIYMPNLWPLIFGVFVLAVWVFFVLFLKFGLAVASEAFELVRRIIELIPGF